MGMARETLNACVELKILHIPEPAWSLSPQGVGLDPGPMPGLHPDDPRVLSTGGASEPAPGYEVPARAWQGDVLGVLREGRRIPENSSTNKDPRCRPLCCTICLHNSPELVPLSVLLPLPFLSPLSSPSSHPA